MGLDAAKQPGPSKPNKPARVPSVPAFPLVSRRQSLQAAKSHAPLHPQGPQLPHVRLARLPRRARPIQPVTTRSSSCRSRRRIEAGREARRCCSARARSVNRWRWPMRYKACPSPHRLSRRPPGPANQLTASSSSNLCFCFSLLPCRRLGLIPDL